MNFVIIGMHIQGLIAAGLLSKAGHNVQIIDIQNTRYEEYYKGYKTGPVSHFPLHLSKQIITDLNLSDYGFEADAYALDNPFKSMAIYDDLKKLLNIFRLIEKNRPLYQEKGWRDAWSAFEIGRLLAEETRDLQDIFAQLVKSSLTEFLETYKSDNGEILARAILCAKTDLTAKETAITLLQAMEQYEPQDNDMIIRGACHSLLKALKESAMANGVSIKTDTTVQSLEMDATTIKSVLLTNGDVVTGDHYIIDCDPIEFFRKYMGQVKVSPSFENIISSEKNNSITIRAKMALSCVPETMGHAVLYPQDRDLIIQARQDLSANGQSSKPIMSVVNIAQSHESLSYNAMGNLDLLVQYYDPGLNLDNHISDAITETMIQAFPELQGNILSCYVERGSSFDGMADFVGAMPLLRLFKIFSGHHALAYDIPIDNAVMVGYGDAAPAHYHTRHAGQAYADLYAS